MITSLVLYATFGADCYSQTFPRVVGGDSDQTLLNGIDMDSGGALYLVGKSNAADLKINNINHPIALKMHANGPY